VLSDVKADHWRFPADILSAQDSPESNEVYKYPFIVAATIFVHVLSHVNALHWRDPKDVLSNHVTPESNDVYIFPSVKVR
jgi:hypothetical protein